MSTPQKAITVFSSEGEIPSERIAITNMREVLKGVIGANELKKDYTKSTFNVTDNLDAYTQIAAGQRLVLRFNLGPNGEIALVGMKPPGGGNQYILGEERWATHGLVTGAVVHLFAPAPVGKETEAQDPRQHALVETDYTRARRTTYFSSSYESGPVTPAKAGQSYADTSGLLFGWYNGSTGMFTDGAGSKTTIQSMWLDGTELKIAVKCEAASGGPYTLGGVVVVVY